MNVEKYKEVQTKWVFDILANCQHFTDSCSDIGLSRYVWITHIKYFKCNRYVCKCIKRIQMLSKTVRVRVI